MAPIYMILLKFLKKLHEIEKNGFEALEGPSRSVSNLMACFLCSHCEGYVFTRVCLSTGGVPGPGRPGPMGCLVLVGAWSHGVPGPRGWSGPNMSCRFSGPYPRGKLSGDLVQVHTQGGS